MLTEDDAIVPSVNKPSAAATNEKETNQSEACGLNCHIMSVTKIDCCEFHISVVLTCVANIEHDLMCEECVADIEHGCSQGIGQWNLLLRLQTSYCTTRKFQGKTFLCFSVILDDHKVNFHEFK